MAFIQVSPVVLEIHEAKDLQPVWKMSGEVHDYSLMFGQDHGLSVAKCGGALFASPSGSEASSKTRAHPDASPQRLKDHCDRVGPGRHPVRLDGGGGNGVHPGEAFP
jgi:hypothetical protein